MFTLRKTFRFEAAHKLPHHDGKCARLHGHSWVMHVEVRGEQLWLNGPKAGMLTDFGDISRVVKPFVEDVLDHHYLNDSTPLENPTSEELSRWVFGVLSKKINGLSAVEIEETCTSSCRYCETP